MTERLLMGRKESNQTNKTKEGTKNANPGEMLKNVSSHQSLIFSKYGKTSVKHPLKNKQNIDLNDKW